MDNHKHKLIEAFSYHDYKKMFELDETMLQRKIIDFPGCFSGFNAIAHTRGEKVISLDAIYDLDFDMVCNVINQQSHLWKQHVNDVSANLQAKSIAEEKYERFKTVADLFLQDYLQGKEQKRYQAWDVENKLPFEDHTFQLALCSHWLFKQCYSLKEVIDFIDELCRVAGEVRIFPITNQFFETPKYLGHLMANFQTRGYKISCLAVDFDEHEPGSAMLSIVSPKCAL